MIKVEFEDGRTWGKADRSGDNGGDCVCVTIDGCGHVATNELGQVGIRDSKLGPTGPVLWASAEDFAALKSLGK